jgi:hypothetical protein
MKVTKHADRYYVRVEELLPCPRFACIHEAQFCAIAVWCPDGCYDTNTYYAACIPKCIDCIHYSVDCDEWRSHPDKEECSALSKTKLDCLPRTKIVGVEKPE